MVHTLRHSIALSPFINDSLFLHSTPDISLSVRLIHPFYTSSWEQRKFDEVFDCTVPNNTLSRAELSYDEGTVLNVHYGDVLIKYGSVLDVQKDDIPRIPHRCREDFNGALLQDGDVIIADTAEDETTGKACEIGNLQGSAIVSGLHTMVCRPRNRMALGYLGYYLNSNAYHHQLLPLMQGIKVLSLSRSNIQKTSVSYPIAVKEQQLIAYYFSQLDNLITLHQRKCALLFSPFQAFISMMFTTSTFSWEQREVGDLLIERSQQAPMSDEYPLMAFIANEGVAPKGERYDRSALVTDTVNKLYKKTEKGDFIYSSNNLETGSIGLNKYGKACISPVYSIFEPTGIADSDFLGRRLVRKDFINAMVKWRQGVIYGQWRIHESDFLKIEISVPSVEEQRKIGAYLDQLDNLITLHQRKCIFFTGRAGRLISTVNKKRITSSWEQRKLGEMGQTCTGLSGKTKDDFGHGQARFVTYMNVFSNPISNPEMTEPIEIDPKQNEVEVGDVFFTTSSETPEEVGMSSILLEKRGKTYLNSFCFGFRPSEKIDSYYLAYMLRSESTRAKIILLAQGISRYNISKNKVMEIAVSLPSLDEQKMIGQYFSQLDNLITLHQRKPFLMKWRTSDANRNQTNRLVL